MTSVLARIQHLLALATNDKAEREEARTAAHIAARLIRGHGIALQESRATSTGPTPARTIRSRYVGHCTVCGNQYRVGDLVSWAKGRGSAHASCAKS